jgi:hypothetical protein
MAGQMVAALDFFFNVKWFDLAGKRGGAERHI